VSRQARLSPTATPASQAELAAQDNARGMPDPPLVGLSSRRSRSGRSQSSPDFPTGPTRVKIPVATGFVAKSGADRTFSQVVRFTGVDDTAHACRVTEETTIERVETGSTVSRDSTGRVSASPDPPDEVLVVRFQSGDRAAFALLVRRHQSGLYNFALRNLRERTAAEDIVQEAFVRVAQSAADFKSDARFSTWVYTIVRNLCIDQIRKNALRRHPSLDEARKSDDGDGPTLGEQTADPRGRSDIERTVEVGRMKERILAAIDALPDDQREVYLMREMSNLRFKEIAEITGVPENTVKSRMRYALERLQEALAEFEEHARALT
jgi:RNA polymerase sigma-70 factor (ECF subfamily)